MSEQDGQHGGGSTLPDAQAIESFSQLPFVRPKAPPSASGSSPTSIRLFGFDVPPDAAATSSTATSDATGGDSSTAAPAARSGDGSGSGGGRKFECHYCCRNFSTSQALGGHQNAHKRERQHAKRAQYQSAMAMHHYPGAHAAYPAFSTSYHHHHRFGMARYDPPPPPPGPPAHYPSWSSHLPQAAPPVVPRYYGGAPGSLAQPINGSPVPASALWRVPAVNLAAAPLAARQERVASLSLAARCDEQAMEGARGKGAAAADGRGGGARLSPSSTSSSSASSSRHERRRGDAAENRGDNVSLDLTL